MPQPCVVFDFSDVLFADPMGEVQDSIAAAAGADRRDLGDFYAEALRDPLWRGTIAEPEFWRRILAYAGLPIEPDRWREFLLARTVPLPSCRNLRAWAERATLYLLSNQRTEWLEPALARYGYLDAFKARFISDRMGHLKPEDEVYEAVLQAWRGPASEALFVDDQEAYLDPARQHGMTTLLAGPGQSWWIDVDKWLDRGAQ